MAGADYKFDWPRFLEERKHGLPVSDADKRNFQLFNVVQALSMDPNMRRVAHDLNEISFSHLPRDIQAIAMQGLNKVRMDIRWSRAKTATIREKNERIEHAMKATGLSHNDIVASAKYGLIDFDALEDRYIRLYEPEKLLEKYGKKTRRTNRKEHAAGIKNG